MINSTKKFVLFILGLMVLTIVSCTNSENKPEASNIEKPKKIFIEAEEMILTDAEIIIEDGTRGNKVIKLLSEKAVATTEITIPKGKYVMNAFMKTKDEMTDGFFLIVDDKVKRTNNYRFNQWLYGMKFIIFDSDGINPIKIQVTSSCEGQLPKEFGMYIDYLEIIEFCNSAKDLELWIK